jgi:hypothetical protein
MYTLADAVPQAVMTFYDMSSQNLSVWTAFPTAAYTDERVWQMCVPGPGGILGAKIDGGHEAPLFDF